MFNFSAIDPQDGHPLPGAGVLLEKDRPINVTLFWKSIPGQVDIFLQILSLLKPLSNVSGFHFVDLERQPVVMFTRMT